MSTECMPVSNHPFNRSGLAGLSDLDTPEWSELFAKLESDQSGFLAKASEFRSPDYKWPGDPLHTWSRVWEYPYAYHHLQSWRRTLPANHLPHVVDLGSGVTFFPFSVARLGCRVTCTDTDPVAGTDLQRAAGCVPQKPGSVEFRLCGDRLPFEDGEVDALFCISVLEHIPGRERTVSEVARVLRHGGLLVLTMDLDLRGDSEIGIQPYRKLMQTLEQHFDYQCPDRTVHPADILTSKTGPFPVAKRGGLKFAAREAIRRALGRKPRPRLPFVLAAMGLVLTRKLKGA